MYFFNPNDTLWDLGRALNNHTSVQSKMISVNGEKAPYTRSVSLTDKQLQQIGLDFESISREKDERMIIVASVEKAKTLESVDRFNTKEFHDKFLDKESESYALSDILSPKKSNIKSHNDIFKTSNKGKENYLAARKAPSASSSFER